MYGYMRIDIGDALQAAASIMLVLVTCWYAASTRRILGAMHLQAKIVLLTCRLSADTALLGQEGTRSLAIKRIREAIQSLDELERQVR